MTALAGPLATDAGQRLRAILLYCMAFGLFACLDTAAKYAGRYVPPIEAAWVRFAGHFLVALMMIQPWRDPSVLRPGRPLAQIVRGCFLLSSTVFNFLALSRLQLAETISINFAASFVVAGLAGPFLGEWAGPRRWAAIIVGFIGVLVITSPGRQGFDPAVLLSICSLVSNAGYILMTRRLAGSDSAASLLVYAGAVPTAGLAAAVVPVAVLPPTAMVAAAMLATGVLGAVGHWLLIHAHRLAPAPVLAPFMYSQLIWAAALGYIVFGDLPAHRTLAGALIIVLSGLYVVYRERMRGHG